MATYRCHRGCRCKSTTEQSRGGRLKGATFTPLVSKGGGRVAARTVSDRVPSNVGCLEVHERESESVFRWSWMLLVMICTVELQAATPEHAPPVGVEPEVVVVVEAFVVVVVGAVVVVVFVVVGAVVVLVFVVVGTEVVLVGVVTVVELPEPWPMLSRMLSHLLFG